MSWFSGKDWNVIAIIYERKDFFRVNGNRRKGREADTARDGAKSHQRTVYWAVFDQKRSLLEGEPGPGHKLASPALLVKLKKELLTNPVIREVLTILESGSKPDAAKPMAVADATPPEAT